MIPELINIDSTRAFSRHFWKLEHLLVLITIVYKGAVKVQVHMRIDT